VFIDAQASINKNPGLMQNFMTSAEATEIDAFYAIRDVASDYADFRLIDIVREELGRGVPVFIYANKNGAHFPYDSSYPASAAVYHPNMREAGGNEPAARIASYRNAIAWSVDRFMARLFESTDLSDTVMVYTSDHGQNLKPGSLSHCETTNADPRTAYVPLMVHAADPAIRQELARGAALSAGRASHFQIVPSVLSWLGYSRQDIATVYAESLAAGPAAAPAFTTGDVFGMFSNSINWTPADLGKDYLEPEARSLMPARNAENAGS
jgi:lipid A ethanolaminephosphotransferase